MRTPLIAASALAAALAIGGCGGGDSEDAGPTASAPDPGATEASPEAPPVNAGEEGAGEKLDPSDEAAVTTAVEAYIDALNRGDGRAVCTDGGEDAIDVSELPRRSSVRAAAVGAFEHLRATSRPGLRSLAYLGIGTGLAAGLVLDGRLHRGDDGMAGEIGHVVVDPAGPPCRCGQSGCLEAVAAGPALQRIWPDGDGRPAEAMLSAAEAGDAHALRRTKEVIDRYVLAVQWLAAAWNAELIALGGGIGSIGEPLLGPVRERLASWAARSDLASSLLPPERVVSLPAGLPAGALGAAALARRSRRETLQPIEVDSGDPSGRGE